MTPNNVRRGMYVVMLLAVVYGGITWNSDSPIVPFVQAAMGSFILVSLGWLAGYHKANRDAMISSVMASMKRLSAKRGGRV